MFSIKKITPKRYTQTKVVLKQTYEKKLGLSPTFLFTFLFVFFNLYQMVVFSLKFFF